MKKASYKKVNLTSSNLSEEKFAELRRILPEAFSEEKIDWDKLRTVLDDGVDSGIEKFGFTWAGKSSAIKNVLIPSKATLTPVTDESVKFSESDNLFIEGDNLEVLKLLQKAYFEKVKMIYIDPPYNTGGDFVYKDNFASPVKNYLEQTGQIDSEGNKLSTNKETNGRYHSDWLSMMYPRLKLAWNLLRDDGVIFVSIGEKEVHHLRILLNEIFGEENFVLDLPRVTKKAGKSSDDVSKNHDYILVFKKNKDIGYLRRLEHTDSGFKYTDEFVEKRGLYKLNQTLDYSSIQYSKSLDYEIILDGEIFRPGNVTKEEMLERQVNNPDTDFCWRWSRDLFEFGLKNGFIVVKTSKNGKRIYTKTYQLATISENDDGYFVDFQDRDRAISSLDLLDNRFSNDNAKKDLKEIFNKAYFDYSKPVALIQELLLRATEKNNNDLIIDFFAGSGTTAQAILELNSKDGGNRKFILIQLPEHLETNTKAYIDGYRTVSDITKERIRCVTKKLDVNDGFKVFKLAESNYPENTFEFDPKQSEAGNKKTFEGYLDKAKQNKLIDDVNEVSIIYENIVKEGFSLNSNIAQGVKGENKIYTITDGNKQFSICLDRDIKNTTVNNLMEWAKGTTFICFDNALDDSAKANISLVLELKTI